MKRAFVSIICASAVGIATLAANNFLDSNNLFMFVPKKKLNSVVFFVGKFVFPISHKYLRGTL